MSTLVLTKNDVSALLTITVVIKAVEQAFRDWAEGKAAMPPKSYLVTDKGDFRAMPASVPGAVGLKWVNVHPQNISLGLPTVMAVLIYNDAGTGYPLAIMDATELTAYRTGATAALASRYLARRNARTLGIIGAGRQAYTQLLGHVEFFQFTEIRVHDVRPAAVERFINSFPQHPVKASAIEEAAAADIVCTVTTARAPVVKKEWIGPGAHINAIGADAPGKEELEASVLQGAMIIVDDLKQASTSGEINVPLSKGLIRPDDIHGTLAEIIAGKKAGRQDDTAITIFDSTGVAIEDVATARLVYEKAKASGRYLSLDFIDG